MIRVAYLVSQFPETHESFIVREVQALARRTDLQLTIFSLKHCRDRIIQQEARPFLGCTRYPSARASARGAAVLLRSPRARQCLVEVIREYRARPSGMARGVATLVRAAALIPALRQIGRPHIHAHWATMPALAAYFLRRVAGARYSLTAHAWDIYADATMLRSKISEAEFVVTCTAANRDYLATLAGAATPVVLSYHGLDFDHVMPPTFARTGTLSILAVGRLVEQKGYRHLIDACALLAERGRAFHCRIIGNGPLRGALQRQIDARGLRDRVTLTGPTPLTQVFQAYREATVLCVPSVIAADGDRDGIPNVIIEAMSQGLPVVASNVSGIPEVVRPEETGWLAPPGDAAALAQTIDAVAADATQATRLAVSAHAFIGQHFDAGKNALQLVDLFRSVAALPAEARL